MDTTETKSMGSEADFTEFWKNFQPLSLKWACPFINRSWYLVATTLFIYGLLAIDWLFPSLAEYNINIFREQPTIHLLIFGWIAVIILTVWWRNTIPSIFKWVWESGRLGPQSENLEKEYKQFLQEYQKALLSKKGSLSIGISLVILFSWLLVLGLMLDATSFSFYLMYYLFVLAMIFYLFMVGLTGWLLITTSRYIGKLTKRFSLHIQPSHPDRCGGLKPLGNFCFSAAIPLILGGLILVLVSILELVVKIGLVGISIVAIPLLFLVAGPLTMIVIFVPLWNVHLDMVEHKRAYADTFTTQLIALETEIIINTSGQGDLNSARIAKEKIEILQTVHPDKLSYPEWPFNLPQTVLTIFSPQILATLVGLATSIYSAFFK